MVTILGIHDGHTSTATIVKDGVILSAISEERITRVKSMGGCPKNAIKEVFRIANMNPKEIDIVAISSFVTPISQEEMLNEKKLVRKIFSKCSQVLPVKILGSKRLIRPYQFLMHKLRNYKQILEILKELNVNAELKFVEHHQAHAATAAYTSWYNDKDTLVITCDGSGDGICATISILQESNIKRIYEIPSFHSIGEFYTRITQFLGMKPLEHEYKVMGLAPYAPLDYVDKIYNSSFKSFFEVNGTQFYNRTGKWGRAYLSLFKNKLEGVRFDVVADATQRLLEKTITTWIRNVINETGIHNVACAGGVFMNVKLNMLLHEMEEIEQLFVFSSCGDESVAIGAALQAYVDYCRENGKRPKINKWGPIYWGGEFDNDYISGFLNKSDVKDKLQVEYINDIEGRIAQLLAEGSIVARFNGRMEWGARALGNRSILANPSDNRVINRLNRAIKKRDFWMPFTPSILYERKDDYLIAPNKTKSPYMIMAYRTTELAQKELIAALHPYDLTARPQVLEKNWNPSYYKILSEFEKITGIGGVLNTSFNLHGDPIVYTPSDAVYTLLNSSLDYLAMGNYLIRRR